MKSYKNTNNRILPLDTVNVSFKSTERWTHRGVKDILEAYSNSLGYGFSVNYKEKRYYITTDKATITLFYNYCWSTFVMSFSVPPKRRNKRRKCTFDAEYFFAHLNIEGVKETKKVFGKSKVYRYKAILKKHGICPYYLEIAEMVTKLEFPKYISYHIRLPRKNRKQYKPVRLNNIIYIKVAFNLSNYIFI